LSLYNALSGKSYTDPELLEIVTLNGAIYMGMKNDLSFLISSNLYLYEHQSTDNPNLPLRDLFYIAEQCFRYNQSNRSFDVATITPVKNIVNYPKTA
jgi:hypothetical protein